MPQNATDFHLFHHPRDDLPWRMWMVSAIHGRARVLSDAHTLILRMAESGDKVVYTGNLTGYGKSPLKVMDSILAFRKAFLGREALFYQKAFMCDIGYLRGGQEHMWSKLLQIHLADKPKTILEWVGDHGIAPTLEAYGVSLHEGLEACDQGAAALALWTARIKAQQKAYAGHGSLLTSIKNYGVLNDTLFLHQGLDFQKPLSEQGDNFWWGVKGFHENTKAYQDGDKTFNHIYAGKHHGNYDNVHQTAFTTALDGYTIHDDGVLLVGLIINGKLENVFEFK